MHSGIHGETLGNAILGQLPKRIIVGFERIKLLMAFNINYLSLYIDGVQVPSKPLQPDFKTNNMYIDAYHTLFSGTGIHYLNEGY